MQSPPWSQRAAAPSSSQLPQPSAKESPLKGLLSFLGNRSHAQTSGLPRAQVPAIAMPKPYSSFAHGYDLVHAQHSAGYHGSYMQPMHQPEPYHCTQFGILPEQSLNRSALQRDSAHSQEHEYDLSRQEVARSGGKERDEIDTVRTAKNARQQHSPKRACDHADTQDESERENGEAEESIKSLNLSKKKKQVSKKTGKQLDLGIEGHARDGDKDNGNSICVELRKCMQGTEKALKGSLTRHAKELTAQMQRSQAALEAHVDAQVATVLSAVEKSRESAEEIIGVLNEVGERVQQCEKRIGALERSSSPGKLLTAVQEVKKELVAQKTLESTAELARLQQEQGQLLSELQDQLGRVSQGQQELRNSVDARLDKIVAVQEQQIQQYASKRGTEHVARTGPLSCTPPSVSSPLPFSFAEERLPRISEQGASLCGVPPSSPSSCTPGLQTPPSAQMHPGSCTSPSAGRRVKRSAPAATAGALRKKPKRSLPLHDSSEESMTEPE